MFLKFNENKLNEDNIFSESDDKFKINYNKKKIDQREKFLADDEPIVSKDTRKNSNNKSEEGKYMEINSNKTSEKEDEMIDEHEYMLNYRGKKKKKLYVSLSDYD